ncbi:polysaccharide deacetylase family protein [Kitasatospora sp. NPDC005856]|uniref:polysaccharide deacetylase family protein n=1 Tax=Kitasatospora sp. NPDC005856 TaxID=3154566 RepID=UPI0033F80895
MPAANATPPLPHPLPLPLPLPLPHPTANHLLGHPPDARLLLLNCDDLGLDESVNLGVIDAVRNGIAASCSLMTPCAAAPHALRLLRRHPEVPFGVHLTLVCESTDRRWGPLTARARVPSLLDASGGFFAPTPAGRAALLAQARLDDIEREFRAQIDAVAAAGLAPTHLDFHCLADGGREDVLDLTLALGAAYGLAVRVWLPPALARVRGHGLPVVDHGFLDSFSVPLDDKPAHYARLLAALPPGLTEWALHPSVAAPRSSRATDPRRGPAPGPNHRAPDDGRRIRHTDHAFLVSPEARRLLTEHGVTVLGYRTLQEAWQRARGRLTAEVAGPPGVPR